MGNILNIFKNKQPKAQLQQKIYNMDLAQQIDEELNTPLPPTMTKGILTYRTKTTMKKCHIELFSKPNKQGGHDIRGNWLNLGINYFIKDFVKWSIPEYLKLNNNHQMSMLNDIVHIQFPRLKVLELSANRIQSIQQIQNLQAPMLQSLHLSKNNIVNYQSLRKIHVPHIKLLQISLQQIVEIRGIFQIGFSGATDNIRGEFQVKLTEFQYGLNDKYFGIWKAKLGYN